MCQASSSVDPARQRLYQFGTGALVLLVVACGVLLALCRSLGYEAAVVVGLLAAAWRATCRWRLPPRLAFLTVAAAGAYFASYYLSLYGKAYVVSGVDVASGVNRHTIEPIYLFRPREDTGSFLGPSPDTFFGPALWVDRHVVRRVYWVTVENRAAARRWRNP